MGTGQTGWPINAIVEITEEEYQMQRRFNLTHFILAVVMALSLTPLMIVVDAQAQIVFMSDRVWDDFDTNLRRF